MTSAPGRAALALATAALALALVGVSTGAQQPAVSETLETIDLATALRLAGLNNLDLALVRTAERQAKAANDAATLGFFPGVSIGENFARTTGSVQQTSGAMLDVNRALYRRGAAIGMSIPLGDAIFAKLAARQLQIAAVHDVESQRSDALLAAANAYFNLVDAVAERDIAAQAVQISEEYQSELERAADIGLTNRSEALRVAVRTQESRVTLRGAKAQVRAAAATLATVLRLDPSVMLSPAERLGAPPTLGQLETPRPRLIETAMQLRPELKASAAAVVAAERQRTAAKYGPFIPSLGARVIYGQSRGGQNGALDAYQPTHDYAVGLSWQFGPGGIFDFSRTEAADSRLDRRQLGAEKLRQSITAQVVTALTSAEAARDQMLIARQGVELAVRSLTLSMQRKQFGVYAVTEVIEAQKDLTRSRSNYAEALARYAKAQYALARATGRISR